MRALVTGGAKRVGRAICLSLAEAGFEVLIHHRASPEEAQTLAQELCTRGARASVLQADLAQESECSRLATQAGPLDLLVNNAAAYAPCALADLDAATWDAMMAINLRAPFLLSRAFADSLAKSTLPGGGHILNLADIGAERPAPGFVHYAVSKAGIVMLTKALALELAPRVRVNAIAPGTVLAPEDLGPAQLARIRESIPLGRLGSPEDIARAALFLTLGAPYISGQVLAVDGARSLMGPLSLDRPEP
jgi:pteridine reductase